eukprot:Protomagalhaensia_wolfi_Nauph_80__2603@NODE_274_length_2962_cov_28_534382_g204_i0_p2_GENE_NODE_274_length_2962_cov_28_534382_g204_i0NODE_274_length_2962_cov_28_534382_g204_i0_p2_ORF_typecomplete_len212_score44_51Ebola_NP/PF05505_12/9_2_NODE_274_length_2962_cov_28_534382_g204_i05371172
MSTYIQDVETSPQRNLFDEDDTTVIDENGEEASSPTTAVQDDSMEDRSNNMDEGNNQGNQDNPEIDQENRDMNEDDTMRDGNDDESQPLNDQQGRPGKKKQRGPRSIEILDEIYNPELHDKEKSLWQFWNKDLRHLPDVDSMARDLESRGLKVDMEQLHYDWFHNLLRLYREYLQTAFGDALELPVLGRRLQRFQESNRSMCSWRYEWIRK